MSNYLAINQNSIDGLKQLRTFAQGAKMAASKECSYAFSFIEQTLNEMIAEQLAIIDGYIKSMEAAHE